jgi:predicted transcriptional regulator
MDRLPVVRECMARKLLTLKSDTEILDAVAFLLKHKISGAPVVDDDKHPPWRHAA